MKNKTLYKAAIVGCGRVAGEFDDDLLMRKMYGIFSHAGGYLDSPEVELVAAADVDKEKLAKFGERWKVRGLYNNYQVMLAKEKVDILSICTWNSSHFDIFNEAVKQGVKAVFCEKPISNSLINADKMNEVAKQHNLCLMVNHSRRWDKLYQEVRALINDKGLGDVQQVSCYYTAGIANTCSHLFDVLRMFFGEVESVSAYYKGDPSKDDPNIDGYIKFKNGVTVTIQSLDVKSYTVFEFDIYGTKGRLRIQDNGFGLTCWEAKPSNKYLGYNELFTVKPPFDLVPKQMMRNAVNNMVQCLSVKEQPMCSGEDGVKALEMICAFHLSARRKGELVAFPLIKRDLVINSK